MPRANADHHRRHDQARSGAHAILHAADLSFAYDSAPVLQIAELSVEPGSITALIGHNGCGKTTLFKVANGLLAPYEGSLQFQGLPVRSAQGRQLLRRQSVYVHQHPYIFRESVAGNLAFALRTRRVAREERPERIRRALAAVGLEAFARRRADGLSGGERQRVAIARALALDPELLFLDEPTSNIDPESVALIESAVLAAKEAGTTVLLSTHNLATAYRIADRVVPMAAGRVRPNRNNIYHGQVVDTPGGETRRTDVQPRGADLAGAPARSPTDSDHHPAAPPEHDATTRRFRMPGGELVVPARPGSFTAAVVPMDDVFLARRDVTTSARNHFRGRVSEIAHVEDEDAGDLYRVRLDCGFPLDVLVTRDSLEELGIKKGSELFAGFKASAVQLF